MTLWEAMSGSPVEGWEDENLEPMRQGIELFCKSI